MSPKAPEAARRQPRSRYPGTQPFGDSAEDQARFFGRAEEAEELYLRVLSVPLLVQFGRSGLGKTSLLQAGLFPRLRQKPFLPAMIRLNDATDSLTSAVTRSLQEACDAEGLDLVPGDASSLRQLLATTTIWRGDLLLTPVLVFDQFEEVFTLRDAEFRRGIATELGALGGMKGGSEPPAKIVISLREDFLGALEEFSAALPTLFHERLRLEAMSKEAARAAITGPARLVPGPGQPPYASPRFEFDPPALRAMIVYLQGSSGVIEPFQLQLLCGHAEAIATKKGSGTVTLTLEDFRAGEEFTSVLDHFYRSAIEELSPRSQQKKAALLCEDGLLDAAGHRLMLHEAQILTEYRVKPETLATLTRLRLIRTERRLDSTFYEISHDRLAESIAAARRARLPAKIRRLLWAVCVAAVVVVALLVAWNRSISLQRRQAQAARDSAEGLLTFLLGEDFLGQIRDTGRSAMLDAVRTNVDQSGAAGRTPLNRALALRHQGDMRRMENDLSQALQFQRQSLTILASLGIEREIARAQERIAGILNERGELGEAAERYELSVRSWERVIGSGGGAEDCIELAQTYLEAVRMDDRTGRRRSGPVAGQLQKAVGIASDVLFGGEGPCAAKWRSIAPLPDPGAVAVLSEAAYLNGDNPRATVAMADNALKLRPHSAKTLRFALLARFAPGFEPQEAVQELRAGLAGFDELTRWDPRNLLWTVNRAWMQIKLANAIVDCQPGPDGSPCSPVPSLEDAESMTLEALTTLQALAAVDESDAYLHEEIGDALETHARVMAAGYREKEALARLKEAERVRSLRTDDRGQAFLGTVLYRQAALEWDRPDVARETLRRALAIFEPLYRRDPENARYAGGLADARGLEGSLLARMGVGDGAVAAEREAARIREASANGDAAARAKFVSLAEAHAKALQEGNGLLFRNNRQALRSLLQAEAAARQMILVSPADSTAYGSLSATCASIALAQNALGNQPARLEALTAAMNAAQLEAWLTTDQPEDFYLVSLRNQVAEILFERKRTAEALEVVHENVVLAQEMAQRTACTECLWHLGVAKCLFASGQPTVLADGLRGGIIQIERATRQLGALPDKRKGEIFRSLGQWRRALAAVLDRSASKPEATEQRRLAFAAYQQAQLLIPDDPAVQSALLQMQR